MKKMIIAICVAVFLIISGIVTTIIVINTPSIIMGPTISTAISDLGKRDDIKQIQSVLENGSVEFDAVDAEKGTDISGKVYLDLDAHKVMAENLDLRYGDVSLSGSFYVSNNFCYAYNEDIFGGTVGIKAGNAAEDFEKSIFAFGSGSVYAVDKETHDIIYELLSAFDENLSEDMKKDADKLSARYISSIQSLITKYGDFSSEKANVRVGDTRMDARIMTLDLDEEAIRSIVSEFLTEVAEDEKFKEFVHTYGDRFENILESKNVDDSEALYESIIKDINNTLSNIKNEYKGNSISFSIVTPKLSTKLLSFELNINKNGKVDTYSADFGPEGVKNSDHIRLNLNGTNVEYKRGSDGKSFSVVVEDFAKVTYYLDGDGGFELAFVMFYEGEERYEISGTVETIKNVTSYDITNYRYTYNKDSVGEFENVVEKQLDISLKIATKDKMPAIAKEYVSVFDINDEEFAVIEEKLTPIFAKKED